MPPGAQVGQVTLCYEGRTFVRLWCFVFDCTRQVIGVDRRIGCISLDVPACGYGCGSN